jgi:dephospho-CoA kinase
MLIGVTGQIGAGKSTAVKILRSFGAAAVDADKIGRKVVETNPVLLGKLTRAFGGNIRNASGRLNRKKLAATAFADETSRRKLNRLVHPYLLKELRRQVREKAIRYAVVLIDAALLLDWNLDCEMDLTLVIHASREKRLARLARRGIRRADALARERQQPNYAEYRKRADIVILNNGTSYDLARRLRAFWQRSVAEDITD